MTNYEYLMGTPALAAQFIVSMVRSCNTGDCRGCPVYLTGVDECTDYRELRDFLESEMD